MARHSVRVSPYYKLHTNCKGKLGMRNKECVKMSLLISLALCIMTLFLELCWFCNCAAKRCEGSGREREESERRSVRVIIEEDYFGSFPNNLVTIQRVGVTD